MCATSIGFTRLQWPVPGERKSGIPDAVEMPAPVSTAVPPSPASRIIPASFSIAASSMG